MKFLEGWVTWLWPKTNRLDFGGDADHDSDPRFLDRDHDSGSRNF